MNNKLWQSLANAWKLPELRTKVLFTAAMVAIYRFGSYVPTPGIDIAALKKFFEEGGSGVVGFLDVADTVKAPVAEPPSRPFK